MRTLENIFKAFQWFCLASVSSGIAFLLTIHLFIGCEINKDYTRDYEYEAYCDSIWDNNPDYYMDVLGETDEYQDYIAEHGEWWTK